MSATVNMTDGGRRRGIVAAIAAITVVAVASTLTMPLLTLLMERMGRSASEIGFNTALASIGIILAGPIGGRALARFGVPAVMLAAIAVMAAALMLLSATAHFWLWCALRLILGCCYGLLFLGSEFWLLAVAPPARRGRVIAFYAATLAAGYAAGPALLKLTGVDGFAPFAGAIALAALAAVPILAFAADAPAARDAPEQADGATDAQAPHAGSPWRYFRTEAMLVAAVILFGAIEFGAMGLLPVWALAQGYSEDQGITFAIILAVGNFLCLPLIGWVADRVSARPLLMIAAGASVLVSIALNVFAQSEAAVWALLFLWGGTAIALYTVALSEMGARYQGGALAGGNAALVAAYGIGATVGPLLIGGSMQAFGPAGLTVVVLTGCAAFLALAVLRGATNRAG